MTAVAQDPGAILDFWFDLKHRNEKDDERVREGLGGLYARARDGGLDIWLAEPRPRLSVIVLLDQVPRHLFRDKPNAYATDVMAQAATLRFVKARDWGGFLPLERYFAVAPWLHAEDAYFQDQVNPIIHELAEEDASLRPSAGIADLYRETIGRFGRFPHRNAILGRESSPEEMAFLENEWGPRKRAAHGEGAGE